MDAVFIDKNGNKKNFLYQYDVGQTFIVENFEYSKAPKVQFSIKSIKTAPSVGSKLVGSDLHVTIPDMLLTYGESIIAYLYVEDATKRSTVETIFISVIPRKRPADYIYTNEMFVRSVNGSVVAENSGISEVAAWADGNTNNQDRIGYFVSISYDTYNKSLIVNKATSINDVYGVAVDKAGIALNCDESKLDNDGDLMLKYAYVCTSGFATVIDNGKCTVGQMCVPNSLGTAVASDDSVGYKVVSRIDDRHVLIFVDPCMQAINNFQGNVDNVKNSLNSHIENKDNPHLVTKAQIGLGNVNNTSDINKPVSEAQSKAIADAKKAGTDAQSTIDQHIANVENPHQVTAHQVGAYTQEETDAKLASLVDTAPEALNTLNELAAALGDDPNFATTMSTELGKKATKDEFNAHVNRVDNPHSVTKAQVGLDQVDNTSDLDKPISNATQNALNEINNAIAELTPKSHASTHATGGEDAISPADIGAATQTDFDALKNKVDSLAFSNGIVITDSVTSKQYTLGMQNGKLVVILIDDNTTA